MGDSNFIAVVIDQAVIVRSGYKVVRIARRNSYRRFILPLKIRVDADHVHIPASDNTSAIGLDSHLAARHSKSNEDNQRNNQNFTDRHLDASPPVFFV